MTLFYKSFLGRFLLISTALFFCNTALLSSQASARSKRRVKPKVRIAVLWTTGDDVKGAARSRISQKIRISLRKNLKSNALLKGKAGVGNRKSLVRVLQQDRICKPTQRGCDRKVARALDATHYLLGEIIRNEDVFEIKISLHGTQDGALLAQASGSASKLRLLEEEAPFVAEELTTEIIALVKIAPSPKQKKKRKSKANSEDKSTKNRGSNRDAQEEPNDEAPEFIENDDDSSSSRRSRSEKSRRTKIVSADKIVFQPNPSQLYAIQYYGELRIEDDLLLFISAPDSLVKHDFTVPLWKIRSVESALAVPGIILVEQGVDVVRSFSFQLGNGDKKDRFLGALKVAILKSKKRRAKKRRAKKR